MLPTIDLAPAGACAERRRDTNLSRKAIRCLVVIFPKTDFACIDRVITTGVSALPVTITASFGWVEYTA